MAIIFDLDINKTYEWLTWRRGLKEFVPHLFKR